MNTRAASQDENTHLGEDFLFIDNARFLAMAAIVLRHCNVFAVMESSLSPTENCLIQLRSFGVPLFFISTAFLLAQWLHRHSSPVWGYWTNRWDRVVKPWIIWVSIYIGIDLLKLTVRHHLALHDWAWEIWTDIFGRAYWFVPILMFSLAILLPLRRFWNTSWLGCVFLGLSLLYGLNQFFSWFDRGHTLALFAYLFPMWLGLQLYNHFHKIYSWLRGVSWAWIVGLIGLAAGTMFVEDLLLRRSGSVISASPLRLSNYFYTLIVLMVLMKTQFRLAPFFLNVRKENYGIYLIHPIVLSVGRGVIDWLTGLPEGGKTFFERLPEFVSNTWWRIAIWLGWFVLVYAISLGLTKLVRRVSWGALVGAPSGASKTVEPIGSSSTASLHFRN